MGLPAGHDHLCSAPPKREARECSSIFQVGYRGFRANSPVECEQAFCSEVCSRLISLQGEQLLYMYYSGVVTPYDDTPGCGLWNIDIVVVLCKPISRRDLRTPDCGLCLPNCGPLCSVFGNVRAAAQWFGVFNCSGLNDENFRIRLLCNEHSTKRGGWIFGVADLPGRLGMRVGYDVMDVKRCGLDQPCEGCRLVEDKENIDPKGLGKYRCHELSYRGMCVEKH
jgi:hypothetical protein